MPEVEKRLLEETDYHFEAEQTRFFEQKVNLSGIKIPTVALELSSEKILATEWLEGQHLDIWLRTEPEQTKKNQIANYFTEFLLYSLCCLGRIHADPNIGNYLITPTAELGVIDYGCTQQLSPQTAKDFMQLFLAYRSKDIEAAIEYLFQFQVLNRQQLTPEQANSMVKPFVHWISPIFDEKGFNFSDNPDYIRRGYELMLEVHQQNSTTFTSNKDMVFFERTLLGYLRIFQQLNAHFRFDLNKYISLIPDAH